MHNSDSQFGRHLVLGDFNHDGKLDFATSGNLLALGNGDGTFQTPTAIVANPPSTDSRASRREISTKMAGRIWC